MPRFSVGLSAFNGGEISPRLEGRSDLSNYKTAASRMENFLPLTTGPMIHRSGTRYVKTVKDSADITVLIPFVVGTTASYVIEAGDLYFRFYTSEARLENPPGTPVAVVTTYTSAQLRDLQYAQSADTLYLVHPAHPPRKLVRTTATSFTLSAVTFLDGPYLDENTDSTKTLNPSGATGNITIAAVGHTPFLAGRDEGRLVRFGKNFWGSSGWATITAVNTTANVNATVATGSTLTPGAISEWSLGLFYVGNYPRTVTFHEQRLWFGGTPAYLQRVDGSVSGDFERFSPRGSIEDDPGPYTEGTINPDNAVAYTIGSNELNAILWLRVNQGLIIGTSSSLFIMAASNQQEAITAVNVNVREEDMTGSSSVHPARLPSTIFFCGRSTQTLYGAGYALDQDSTVAVDFTELADHISENGIVQIQAVLEPEPMVWIITTDGHLASFTYVPRQKVFAWARHPMGGSTLSGSGGLVRSIAAIPTVDHDQLWLIVERRINGATVQYVEFLEDPFRLVDRDASLEDSFFVDSGVTYDTPITISGATKADPVVITATGHGLSNGDRVRITNVLGMTELNRRQFLVANKTANDFELTTVAGVNVNGTAYTTYATGGEIRLMASTFSGLSHLEGETVRVLADGAPSEETTVTAGQITLTEPASHVHVGLGRDAIYQSVRIETPDPEGSSMGKRRNFDTMILRLADTLGGSFGPDSDLLFPILYRTANDPMDEPVPIFTGERRQHFGGGWTQEPRIVIEQTQPLPMTVLSAALQGEGAPR